jgi:CRP/FNR family transcriptional regulator, dissimilatory nitrate respiration regulator
MLTTTELASHPLLRNAPSSALDAIVKLATERSYTTDEVIFTAGSPANGLYLLVAGGVRVVRGRRDRQHVIHLEKSGGTLGEVPLFAGGGYPATAIASEPTRCFILSHAALRAAIASSPEFAFLLLERLAQRVRGLVERLDRVTSQTVPARLARYLLDRRRPGAATQVVSLGVTQAQLAEELGTVREIVVRSLRVLCDQRLIAREAKGKYRLLDLPGLERAAEA